MTSFDGRMAWRAAILQLRLTGLLLRKKSTPGVDSKGQERPVVLKRDRLFDKVNRVKRVIRGDTDQV